MFEIIKYFNRYRKAYKNPFHMIFKIKWGKFPFMVQTLNSKKNVCITDHLMAYNISWYEYLGYSYSVEMNLVCIKEFRGRLNHPLIFYGAIHDGDLQGVFGQEIYGEIDYNGMTVLDIGANIADSAIYFALNGAKRVVALEPFPVTYDFALRNVEANGFVDKITIINGGIGKVNEKISI